MFAKLATMLSRLHVKDPISVDELLNPPEENTAAEDPTDEDQELAVDGSENCSENMDEDDIERSTWIEKDLEPEAINEHLMWVAKLLVPAGATGVSNRSVSGLREMQRTLREELRKKQGHKLQKSLLDFFGCTVQLHVQGVKPFKDGLSAIDIDHCIFMGKKKSKTPVTYGSVPFVLDASDLSTAKGLELLRDDTPLNTTDFRVPEYGIAYEKKRNIGADTYASQQAVQQRCKEFALVCGFLESYLLSMVTENPGSLMHFEKYFDGTFHRACFMPSIGAQIAKFSRRMHGFDGAHLKGEMNGYGVYLVATCKDYQKRVTPLAFELVTVENYDNWRWFLSAVRAAHGDLEIFTA
ncbi:hypothetical protein L915_15084, partial [Phytophthora nicotianae]